MIHLSVISFSVFILCDEKGGKEVQYENVDYVQISSRTKVKTQLRLITVILIIEREKSSIRYGNN